MTQDNSNKQVQYFQTQRWSFIVLGLDPEPTSENDKALKWPVRCLMSIFATLLLTVLMCCFTIQNYAQVEKLVRVMTVVLQGTLSVLKIVVFLAKYPRFIRLLKSLYSLKSKANEEECKIWTRENQRQELIAKAYYISCSVTGTAYCTIPLIVLLYSYFKGHTVQTLPFEALFPYDYKQPILYIISYAWCVTFTVYAVHANVAVDGLFCWCIFNISAHFNILQQKLQRIANNLCEHNYALFQLQIAYAVRYHRHIIALTDEFRDLFAPMILSEVAVSCLKLCFAAYQLSGVPEPSVFPIIVVTLVTVFMQLTIYCFSGEKVKNASGILADSICMSFPWERMSPAMKRLLLLPIIRAQRRITLTAYIFVVDHSLLVWIFKTTASVIGLLSAVNDGNGNQNDLVHKELVQTKLN